MSNASYLYISYGAKAMMYTLRHFFTETAWTRGEGGVPVPYIAQRDWHQVNLSTDLDTALEKAKAYSEEKELPLSKKLPTKDLYDIQKRNAEEMEAARLKDEEEEAKREVLRMEAYNSWISARFEDLNAGKMPYGMYKGTNLYELPRSYAMYMIELASKEDSKPQQILLEDAVRATLIKAWGKPPVLNEYKGGYIGEKGDKGTVEAQLVSSISFDGYYGRSYVDKFITEAGELVVYMGSASKVGSDDVGKVYEIKYTVKGQEVYKDEEQTKVIRIKLTEKEAASV